MPPKTSRDLISALKGSAFRRAVCDARTTFVRRISTVGRLPRAGRARRG